MRSAHEAERRSGALLTETERFEPSALRRTARECANESTQFGRRETCRLLEQRCCMSADQFRGSVQRTHCDEEVARVVRIRFKPKGPQPQEDILGSDGPDST